MHRTGALMAGYTICIGGLLLTAPSGTTAAVGGVLVLFAAGATVVSEWGDRKA
ncbi:hypothetical protein [Haloferax sp. DFSO60]|uniref:hypothetical protein n=1 Tax=Haloferax sp. DFSO60 TaxID=3388652 RepID=UPI0039780ECC